MTNEEIEVRFACAALNGLIALNVAAATEAAARGTTRKFKEGMADEAWELADIMMRRLKERRAGGE